MSRRKKRVAEVRDAAELRDALGVAVRPELLELALVHRSWSYENGAVPTNERLEFLGDAVLGLAIGKYLFRTHPELPEGQLARRRASLVNMHALARVGEAVGLGHYVRLGRGEALSGGASKPSILADTVEAVIGAVSLSLGNDGAERFVLDLMRPLLDEEGEVERTFDPKSRLDFFAGEQEADLRYEISEAGPSHDRRYTAIARLAGEEVGRSDGTSTSKKDAEQSAAEDAVSRGIVPAVGDGDA